MLKSKVVKILRFHKINVNSTEIENCLSCLINDAEDVHPKNAIVKFSSPKLVKDF